MEGSILRAYISENIEKAQRENIPSAVSKFLDSASLSAAAALARKSQPHYRAEIVPVTDVGKPVLLYSHGAQRTFVGIYCENLVRVVAVYIIGDAEHDNAFSPTAATS